MINFNKYQKYFYKYGNDIFIFNDVLGINRYNIINICLLQYIHLQIYQNIRVDKMQCSLQLNNLKKNSISKIIFFATKPVGESAY